MPDVFASLYWANTNKKEFRKFLICGIGHFNGSSSLLFDFFLLLFIRVTILFIFLENNTSNLKFT